MANSLLALYGPGNVIDSDLSNYPWGKPKDVSSDGAGDGTPLTASKFSDYEGFFQYLLSNAGITPSGTADNAQTSQYFQALKQLLSGPTYAYSTVDQDIGSETPEAVTDIGGEISLAANAVYRYSLRMYLSNADDCGYLISLTGPTGSTIGAIGTYQRDSTVGAESANQVNNDNSCTWQAGTASPNPIPFNAHIAVDGIIDTASTAGTLDLTARQDTADAAALVIRANSFLRVERIG